MKVLKLSWRREVLKAFNMVEHWREWHAEACWWLKSGACVTRADKARCLKEETERESVFG
jgi:hypothetical protein